jgi:hypothetical protein
VKTLSVLVVLVLLVTTVAVSGSRAGPRPAVSAAHRQCFEIAAAPAGGCSSLVSARAAFDEIGADRDVYTGDQFGDAGFDQGQDLSSPEFWREVLVAAVTAIAYTLAEEAAKWAAERLGGGNMPAVFDTQIPAGVFDPVK